LLVPFPQRSACQETTDDVDEDPTGNKALWDRGLLNGASQKAGIVANFHVGEICMSLQVMLAVTMYFQFIFISLS
jgi:hypothetical protein